MNLPDPDLLYARGSGPTGQRLDDHGLDVSCRAEALAGKFGLPQLARVAGLIHDAGKILAIFQRRVQQHTNERFPHAHLGAALCPGWASRDNIFLPDYDHHPAGVIRMMVAAHHRGLRNPSNVTKFINDWTTEEDLEAAVEWSNTHMGLQDSDWDRIESVPTKDWAAVLPFLAGVLIEADRRSAENHDTKGVSVRDRYESSEAIYRRLMAYMESKRSDSTRDQGAYAVNLLRDEIQTACQKAGEEWPKGFYHLTTPTGLGKTLGMALFGLGQAVAYKMDGMIYVAPYITIVDQTADVFTKAMGPQNVFEHHSAIEMDQKKDKHKDEEPDELEKLWRLSEDNWESPVIVTTAVRFFESLFAIYASKIRRLAHVSNRVILIDEPQRIPVKYWKPIMRRLKRLVDHHGCTVVFSSATMPTIFELVKIQAVEIVPDPTRLF